MIKMKIELITNPVWRLVEKTRLICIGEIDDPEYIPSLGETIRIINVEKYGVNSDKFLVVDKVSGVIYPNDKDKRYNEVVLYVQQSYNSIFDVVIKLKSVKYE